MHPELWTIEKLGLTIPTWGAASVVGFLLGTWIGIRRARRLGASADVMLSIAAIGGIAGMIGCRVMHLLHHQREALFSGRLGLKEALLASSGGEIMGGVLLATAAVLIYLLIVRRSIRQYLDIVMPSVILGMGIGRLGCFGFGCCWGGLCLAADGSAALPWAVRFPYGSPAYIRQWEDGQLQVPPPLLWRLDPKQADAQPIPRELLAADRVKYDPLLERYTQLSLRRIVLRRATEQAGDDSNGSPELAKVEQELRSVVDQLPGKDLTVKVLWMGLARHVERLGQREDGEPWTMADLRQLAAAQQALPIHPTQLYDLVSLMLIFLVLSALLYRRRRHGVVLAWTMILYGFNRFVQELIRGDNPHDVAGLTISQFLSILVFVIGLIYLMMVIKVLPPRSPRAEPLAEPATT